MFVGADRIGVVETLCSTFTEVAASRSPRLVSLEAPIGRGKTRIVQEFYSRIAADQNYWPESLAPPGTSDPLKLRKRVHPSEMVVSAGATIPWMWWGVSCGQRSAGGLSQALADDITQLLAHQEALLQRARRNEAMKRALYSVGSFAASFIVPSVSDAVGGAQALRDATSASRSHREARRRAQESEPLLIDAEDRGRSSLVDELSELLRQIGSTELPGIWVLDDAHDADESAVELLDRIFLGPMPIPLLCITTAWPERLSQAHDPADAHFGPWLSARADQMPERIERVEISALGGEDIAALLRERAPATSPEIVDAVKGRADGNPFVLQGILELPRVERATIQGSIEMSVEDVRTLPNRYERVFRELWDELGHDVQEALCVAALQGRSFMTELVLSSYDQVIPERRQAVADVLALAIEPIGWIRQAERWLMFHEAFHFELALSGVGGFLSAPEQNRILEGVANRIAEWKTDKAWAEIPGRTQQMLFELHVACVRRLLA